MQIQPFICMTKIVGALKNGVTIENEKKVFPYRAVNIHLSMDLLGKRCQFDHFATLTKSNYLSLSPLYL